ncbi:hypothetical protein CTheo_5422 [Ceratobasidium theobromae]|uniref:C2H2-type domain-containing protein n=1 Tax=Ceratobasidium theobromae TaxID=1582974 RepID=A0A5N5QHJ0_9AGAM|nr:hypothetical protein CTheo_5422 [Ceratobasidium theobromae]
MSFPPFDSSAPSHTPSSARPGYPHPVFSHYDQPAFGQMGYSDMSTGPRFSQMPLQYSSDSSNGTGSGQYVNQESYAAPSFSPTADQFAQSTQPFGASPNSGAMTFAPSRRRHQSTSAVLSSGSRHPMPRHPSGEAQMPSVQEGHDYVPSQAPPQQFYDSNAPAPRQASTRGSSTNQSLTTSALALEKPYVCDICQTRFARHHDCRRHRETHVVNASGEKPHHCVVCGKSFTRKDALKRHTNQKGCDINAAASNNVSLRSSHSSSSSSPQQVAGNFYPVSNLPHSSSASQTYY